MKGINSDCVPSVEGSFPPSLLATINGGYSITVLFVQWMVATLHLKAPWLVIRLGWWDVGFELCFLAYRHIQTIAGLYSYKRYIQRCFLIPIGSMYGIFTYMYHTNQPNVAKYTIPYMGPILLDNLRWRKNLTHPFANYPQIHWFKWHVSRPSKQCLADLVAHRCAEALVVDLTDLSCSLQLPMWWDSEWHV